jgi:hypothetical protein
MRTRTAFETLNVFLVFASGALGGVVAGTVFGVAQVVAAILQGHSAWQPLQAIAALILGPDTLQPGNLNPAIVVIAIAIHYILSAVFGIILAVLSMSTFAVGTSRGGAILTGMIWGFVIWLLNFFLIAPFAFQWFTTENRAVQLLLHVLFYGAPLGFYLGRTLTYSPRPGD